MLKIYALDLKTNMMYNNISNSKDVNFFVKSYHQLIIFILTNGADFQGIKIHNCNNF